jgi:hypothetical protein
MGKRNLEPAGERHCNPYRRQRHWDICVGEGRQSDIVALERYDEGPRYSF